MSGRNGRPARPPEPPPQPLYTPPTITPPPPDPVDNFRPVQSAQKATFTGLGAKGNVPLAYGRQRLGGEILFVHQPNAWTIYLVVGLCRGEVDSLVSLTVNDKPPSFFGSMFAYWWYPGTPAGNVDPNLAAALPGWAEALPGICYAVVRLTNWQGNMPSMPPQMRWEIKGLKCYDPANLAAPKAYSENLWVQDYDYMRHPEGKALPEGAIYTADWIAAAAIANEVMADASKRYEYHALIRDDMSVDDVMQQFCVAGDGYRWRDGSQFRLFLDRPAAPSGTLGDATLVRQAYSLERGDPFTRPNHVIINFTDQQDAWNENPPPEEAKTAAALAGTEDLVTVTHTLPGIHRRSQARRKAIFLLNNAQFDARLKRRERATGVELQPGDVKTVQLAAKGIDQAFRVIPITKNPDHTYEVELLEYNAARYSDTVVADSSRIKSTLPDFYADPPVVTGLTATEESIVDPAIGTRANVTLAWTAPDFGLLAGYRITMAIDGGNEIELGIASSTRFVVPVTVFGDYVFKVYTVSTAGRQSAAVSASLNDIPTDALAVPWVHGFGLEIPGGVTDPTKVGWQGIPKRAGAQYGAAYWSTANCANVTLSAINDGSYGAKAFDVNVAGESTITLDLGVGNGKEFVEVVVSEYAPAGFWASFHVEYSDDGVAWSDTGQDASNTPTLRSASGGYPDINYQRGTNAWASVGAHRFWRLRQTYASALDCNIAEIQFYEHVGEWPFAKNVIVCGEGADPATQAVATEQPDAKIVESMALGYFHTTGANDSGFSAGASAQIHVVSKSGQIGLGLAANAAAMAMPLLSGWTPDYIRKDSYDLALTSGTYNNKAIPSSASLIRVTGMTAAATLTGLVLADGNGNTAEGGRAFVIWNSSSTYSVTLAHESANSTAANRFAIDGGSNYVLGPGQAIWCVYDTNSSRFRLVNRPTAGATRTHVSFLFEIKMDSSTLKHRVIADHINNTTLPTLATGVTGASATLSASTPNLNSFTGFINGSGVDASAGSRWVFDTADQASYANLAMDATVEYTDDTTARTLGLRARAYMSNLNVNGVTRYRPGFVLYQEDNSTAFAARTSLTSGKIIHVRINMWLVG